MKRSEYLRQQRLRTKKSESRRLSRHSRMIRWRCGYDLPEMIQNHEKAEYREQTVNYVPEWMLKVIGVFSSRKAAAQVRQVQKIDDEKMKAEMKRLVA